MYDIIIEKTSKPEKFFYSTFLSIAFIFLFLIIGFIIYNHNKLNSYDSKTISTKVEIKKEKLYTPIYHYVVNDKKYTCEVKVSSGIKPSTSNKEIYYNSKRPSDCMTEYSKTINYILVFFTLLPIIVIALVIRDIIDNKERKKRIKKLNETGKLVKHIPYHLENGILFKRKKIEQVKQQIIEYPISNELSITLYGDIIDKSKNVDENGFVDLVIDENNYENYYINKKINRLTGNLETDYYINMQKKLKKENINKNNN